MKRLVIVVFASLLALTAWFMMQQEAKAAAVAAASPTPPPQCVCPPAPSFAAGTGCNCTFVSLSQSLDDGDCLSGEPCTQISGCSGTVSVGFTGSCAGSGSVQFTCSTDCNTECTSQRLCPGGGRLTMTLKCGECTQI
jgi:hypothetical protein